MQVLKLAVQKSGRLSERSFQLLKECGIKIPNEDRKLYSSASNFPLEILYLRDDDIPQYVEQGVADIGIVGWNEVVEQDKNVEVVEYLGFAQCRLCLAIPKDADYTGLAYFEHKRIATSYPNTLKNFFDSQGIPVEIEKIGGSVEIAPRMGLADAIFDIVSTGSTLLMNGLKEVYTVLKSEAVLVKNTYLATDKQNILDKFVFRIKAVKNASENKYILLNAPNEALPNIIKILPGIKSPTILPLAETGWSSLHSVVKEDQFWDIIDQLKALGAQGILVCSIEKMVI
ncbi:MAG: ATP phosphoribosyltransferase [Bacteroidia bacterium]|nr:ATP phosphoribosyltransferase [Bacteroidia bacterium]MDW8346947.1 ATP phosphoribosyltransferase [Bacteroidia bacterium]